MEISTKTTSYKDLMDPGSFIGAALGATGIKNAVVIFHGIAGCNIEAVHFRSDQIPGGSYVPIIPSGLNEDDCIQGGTDKLLSTLRDTIKQSQTRNRIPDIIFVLTSDATSIVGDDIHTAARQIESETGVKILALDTAGFLGGIAHGTDIFLSALLEKFEISKNKEHGEFLYPPPCPPHRGEELLGRAAPYTQPLEKGEKKFSDARNFKFNNKINLIAPYLMGSKNWNNDHDEIVRLLEASGIGVNLSIARNMNLQDMFKFVEAAYNLNISGEELESFERKSFELGVNNYSKNLPLPIGAANTEEWLLGIVKDLGDEEKAKEILVKDQKFVQKQLRFNYNFSWMTTLMYQKRCGLLAHAKFGASLARCLLWDFGIIPRVIGLIAETDRAKEQALELLEAIKGQAEFKVLVNPTYFDYGNALKEAEVDFAIGAIHDKPLCLGHKIPHLSLGGFNFFNQYNFTPYPNMGIRGTLGLLSELSRIMEETFYLKDMISAYNYSANTLNK